MLITSLPRKLTHLEKNIVLCSKIHQSRCIQIYSGESFSYLDLVHETQSRYEKLSPEYIWLTFE